MTTRARATAFTRWRLTMQLIDELCRDHGQPVFNFRQLADRLQKTPEFKRKTGMSTETTLLDELGKLIDRGELRQFYTYQLGLWYELTEDGMREIYRCGERKRTVA